MIKNDFITAIRNLKWVILALAILIAFVVTFGTVTWQSYKTARTNPVEALRYE